MGCVVIISIFTVGKGAMKVFPTQEKVSFGIENLPILLRVQKKRTLNG